MSLLHYLSYGGAVAAFIFVTLSLASGLLWLSELIEEHSRLSKAIGQRGIYVIVLLHILLYYTDSLPLHLIVFSVACHVVYLQNFTATWPLVSLSSLSFIASCVLVVIDHFLWFFYFARITQEARHRSRAAYRGQPHVKDTPGFAEIATFFAVCVWLAPLFLFLSLSANDSALPTMHFSSEAVPVTPTRTVSTGGRISLFRSLFDALSLDSLPRLRPKPRREPSQGIIAPPSPSPRVVSTPLPSMTTLSRTPSMSSLVPSRSTTPRRSHELLSVEGMEGFATPDTFSNFSLGPPPKRVTVTTTGSPVRRNTGDGRLEMRRPATNHDSFDKNR